jgi:SAM-dependent methyltransferase
VIKKQLQNVIYAVKWELAYLNLRAPKTRDDMIIEEKKIRDALYQSPISIVELQLDIKDFQSWATQVDYERNYPHYYTENIVEKALEHYVSALLLQLKPGKTHIDIAAQSKVAADVFSRMYSVKTYVQDKKFEPGINENRIGSDAGNIPLEEDFADTMSLHCSFEHFERDSDIRFVHEANRVLRKGGRCVIVPLYLYQHYACYTNPVLSVPAKTPFEADTILYASRHWQNRHGRFYDVPHLVERIWSNRGTMEMTVFVITNWREVHPLCYLRYAVLFKSSGKHR